MSANKHDHTPHQDHGHHDLWWRTQSCAHGRGFALTARNKMETVT